MSDPVDIYGTTGRDLPGIYQDNSKQAPRIGRRGEMYIQALAGAKLYPLADEGSYFLASNPTIGTGIAGIAASTSYDATEHLFWLRNTSTTKRLYLDFIEITVTAAGAAGTTSGFTVTTDRGNSRRGTGGSDITTSIYNVNRASSETAEVSCAFGALATSAASTSVQAVFNGLVRNVIKVVGDTYRFSFGDSVATWQCAGASLNGTTTAAITVPCAPVILGEGDQVFLSDWGASQSGASSYEFKAGFWMR
jgi:hypothetical protein